jgi:hypothetical protein
MGCSIHEKNIYFPGVSTISLGTQIMDENFQTYISSIFPPRRDPLSTCEKI